MVGSLLYIFRIEIDLLVALDDHFGDAVIDCLLGFCLFDFTDVWEYGRVFRELAFDFYGLLLDGSIWRHLVSIVVERFGINGFALMSGLEINKEVVSY